MKSHPVSERLTTLLMLVVAVVATVAIGAWQSIAPSPAEAVEQHSAFVQSGGVTNDIDPGLLDTPQVLGHARAPSAPELAAKAF